MKSHTVPKKLLEQFAYHHSRTRSNRLWRYHKGRAAWGKASPESATRWDGHFADPSNALKENELELRLKREFEDPVNRFLDLVGYRTFVLTREHIRQLTGYTRMLFNRSRARRSVSTAQAKSKVDAFRALLSDDRQLSEIAARYTMNSIRDGAPLGLMFTKADIVAGIEETIQKHSGVEEAQRTYAQTVETMMSFSDDTMANGHWTIVRAEPEMPFVIGDAPVISWDRPDRNLLIFGQGFARPNVEVALPLSPVACLHILPNVPRTRPVYTPSVLEMNIGQAACSTADCFSNTFSQELDDALQPNFGLMQMGVTGFTTQHVDFKQKLFEILMNGGRLPQ